MRRVGSQAKLNDITRNAPTPGANSSKRCIKRVSTIGEGLGRRLGAKSGGLARPWFVSRGGHRRAQAGGEENVGGQREPARAGLDLLPAAHPQAVEAEIAVFGVDEFAARPSFVDAPTFLAVHSRAPFGPGGRVALPPQKT